MWYDIMLLIDLKSITRHGQTYDICREKINFRQTIERNYDTDKLLGCKEYIFTTY